MSQLDRELSEYLETMVEGLGRSERRRALELYLTGSRGRCQTRLSPF
ncbi:hypothetical protein D187_004546 [Cystobacter fuscus DSM 2262]|uniref:Uncharacterized protein n=1 Tax=Cystobacter fuscus (strain ATCC 25194 / DSM 2262 / NBRC 100088 / M29) TaxID=1242864 RepID=S9Q954_CYSF2|nr:hypothetical protein D187_004546 [Cystobacter fuscus DSM 2262]